MIRALALLLLLLPVACLGKYDEEFAWDFAQRTDFLTEASEMSDDPEENTQDALDRIRSHGYEIVLKVDGDQRWQPDDIADDITTVNPGRGPRYVWLAWDWFTKTYTRRAREAWHELVHLRQVEAIGLPRRSGRLKGREVYWNVAFEIPAEVQSLIVFGHHGMSEVNLKRFANDQVGLYKGWGVGEDWLVLAQGEFDERIGLIMDEREEAP